VQTQQAALTENKLEKIVVDEVLARLVAVKLEGLGEVHGVLLLVDLIKIVSHYTSILWGMRHTRRAPVIRIMIPPCSLEGWASMVETWCLTFWKGRPCCMIVRTQARAVGGKNTYDKLLSNGLGAEDGRRLKGEHRVRSLSGKSQ
jgi:hypothetical protein